MGTTKTVIVSVLLLAVFGFSQTDRMRIAALDTNAVDGIQPAVPSGSELENKRLERSGILSKAGTQKAEILFLSFAGISAVVGLCGILDSNVKYGDATEKYATYKSETDPAVLQGLHSDIGSLLKKGDSSRALGMAGVWTAAGCGAAGIVLLILDASRSSRIKRLDREIGELEGKVSLSPVPSGWALAWKRGF